MADLNQKKSSGKQIQPESEQYEPESSNSRRNKERLHSRKKSNTSDNRNQNLGTLLSEQSCINSRTPSEPDPDQNNNFNFESFRQNIISNSSAFNSREHFQLRMPNQSNFTSNSPASNQTRSDRVNSITNLPIYQHQQNRSIDRSVTHILDRNPSFPNLNNSQSTNSSTRTIKSLCLSQTYSFQGRAVPPNRPIVLITNASNGEVGHFLARQFAKRNCKVICVAPSLELLSDLQGGAYDKIAGNILFQENLERIFSFTYPRIDIVLIPPSVDVLGPLSELDRFASPESSRWREIPEGEDLASLVFRSNFLVPLFIAQRISCLMMANKLQGTIAFVGSILGDISTPWSGLFSSSMSAIHSLANSLRVELSPYNIKVLLFKLGYEKSMVVNNNIRGLYFPPNSLYRSIESFIYYRAVWNCTEIESQGKYFASFVVQTCLNRHQPSYFIQFSMSPFKALLSLASLVVIWIVPELEQNFNFFSSKVNPNWPASNWEFTIGDQLSALNTYYKYCPQLFKDWFRWDWLGIGYLSNLARMLRATSSSYGYPETIPDCPVWYYPPISEARTLVSEDHLYPDY